MTLTADGRCFDCALVVGGKYHDMDYARLQLLALLGRDLQIRTRVYEDYGPIERIVQSDFLVTYTCDVLPDEDGQRALRAYVERGGRWLALHGTNSVLRFLDNGKVDAPRTAPMFMDTLGSMFVAHPPIAPYRVERTALRHPLTDGIEPFTTTDELYLLETYGPLEVLLHAHFEGEAPSFVESQWPSRYHPVLYLRSLGRGAVLYFTLGHCRSHFDMRPRQAFYPHVDRGSWEQPFYRELLRRGVQWALCADADRAAGRPAGDAAHG